MPPIPMPSRSSRALTVELAALGLAIVCGLALCVLDLVRPFAPGTVGLEGARYVSGTPFAVRVETIGASSPAARRGIANDDVLRVDGPPAAFRLRTLKSKEALVVTRAATGERIALTAAAAPHTAFAKEWAAIRIVFLILTAVLLGAPQRDRSVRALALFLLSIGLMCDWWTYPPPLAVAGMVLRFGSGAIGFPALIEFALALSRGTLSETTAQRLRAALLPFAAIYALLVTVYDVALFRFDRFLASADAAIYAGDGLIALTVCALLALYAVRATERERQKAVWIALSFFVALAGGLTYLVAQWLVPGGSVWGNAGALAMIALPAGLAYAILRHRLLDVSFAIDQAVAYGIATFVLLVIFTGMDWLANDKLKGPADNRTFVNVIAAGAVLFALRTVHVRVNKAVRETLFRKRMARLATLHEFAKDVRFFVDPALLESELVKKLDRTLDNCGCAHYLRDRTRLVRAAGTAETPETIDLNDAAILRIQRSGSCVRVGEVDSNLRAAYAFPIIARGMLAGVVLIGTDDSLRFYAPDEIEAIHDVVRAAGDTHTLLQAYAEAEAHRRSAAAAARVPS